MQSFNEYDTGGYYDEMFAEKGRPRPGCDVLARKLSSLSDGELERRQRAPSARSSRWASPSTSTATSAAPRRSSPSTSSRASSPAREWRLIERGLKQRIRALNLFIDDIYHEQKIVKDGVVPARDRRRGRAAISRAVRRARVRRRASGATSPAPIWSATATGSFYVLEDNLRCPSGVSYVLENRAGHEAHVPAGLRVARGCAPVDDYPSRLLETLQSHRSAAGVESPTRRRAHARASTTRPTSSTRSWRSRWASSSSRAATWSCRDGCVLMRTTKGFERVDVIYRRIDDDFLDPKVFRADSVLGVPGLMDAYRAGRRRAGQRARHRRRRRQGRLRLRAGDHRATTSARSRSCPNVPTYRLRDDEASGSTSSSNLDELVVKAANESGGYGMLIGPQATADERAEFAERIREQPAQLHRAADARALARARPSWTSALEGRHVDLRPYILYGEDIFVLARRPDARRAQEGLAASSTRRRAAAARTPGCSPTSLERERRGR